MSITGFIFIAVEIFMLVIFICCHAICNARNNGGDAGASLSCNETFFDQFKAYMKLIVEGG